MAKVKAAYNYSYNYEGKKISFKKDEQFQLLSKSNKDWWHVRRWMNDAAQDIYVPAVYVKEVEEPAPCTEDLYMNLDELKSTLKPDGESERKGGGEEGVGSLLRVLQNSNSRNSTKKAPVAKKNVGGGGTGPSPALQTNGFNPSKPASPSPRLNRESGSSGNNAHVLSGNPKQDELGPLGGGHSLKRGERGERGEKLFPPPTSNKPRSKSHTDAFEPLQNTGPSINLESSLDAGTRLGSGFGTHFSGPLKGKLPPPVQMKPKPQKNTSRRPVSLLGPESGGGGGEGMEGSSSKPLVSELSNILMKKNPYLSDHRPLAGSMSTGVMESSTSHSLERYIIPVRFVVVVVCLAPPEEIVHVCM